MVEDSWKLVRAPELAEIVDELRASEVPTEC